MCEWTERRGKHEKACFYFGEGSRFRFLCQWGVAHVSNILVMGLSNGSFKGKNIVGAPLPPMNRSNNKYPRSYSYSTNLPLAWLGWKWWQTISKINFLCGQWKDSAHTQGALIFSFQGWGTLEGTFHFFLVPIKFAICPLTFQWVPELVPDSTSFLSHVCFGKCCPPITY